MRMTQDEYNSYLTKRAINPLQAEADRQTRRRGNKANESKLQQQFTAWCMSQKVIIPQLDYLFSIPNGADVADHHRDRLTKEGMRAGIPDLCLACACHGFHGLYLETKLPGTKQAASQVKWFSMLRHAGYKCEVYRTLAEGQEIVLNYLGIVDSVRRDLAPPADVCASGR